MLRSAEFKNAETAVDYINYIKPLAQKEIISWLDASKYSYTILSEANLNLLKQAIDLALLQQNLLKGEELTEFVRRSVEMMK